MQTTLRTPIRPSSAYQRLPLTGHQLPELKALDALARQRPAFDPSPRLRRPQVPGALAAPQVTAQDVSQWLRS
jgi:hypothetical protein